MRGTCDRHKAEGAYDRVAGWFVHENGLRCDSTFVPAKRLVLTDEQVELIRHLRSDVQSVEDGGDYTYGVIDALAFVWAGMPENASDLYGAVMSQFAELMKKVEEYHDGCNRD